MADRAEQFLEAVRNIPPQTTRLNLPPVRPPPSDAGNYAREGVPLDVTTGVPFWKRAALSFRPDDASKMAFLRRAYQGATVEQAGNNFVIRNVLDPSTGAAKDMLVDEAGLSMADIADMADVAPQIAAEIAAYRGFGIAKRVADMSRVGRVATEAGVSAAASQTGAGLAETFMRLGEDTDGMLTRRTGQALQDAALGGALGGGIEAFASLRDASKGRLTGMLAPGESERAGIRAIQDIEKETGIGFRPTLGQMAADDSVMALETFVSRVPFFGRPFRRMVEAQEASTRELQRKLAGDLPVTPLQDLGAGIVQTVQSEIRQPGQALKMAETSIAERASEELETAIQKMAPAVVKLTPEVTSDIVKYSVNARHNEFRKAANELFTEVGNPEIPVTPLRGLLKDVESDLPSAEIEIPPDATLESLASDFGEEVKAFILDAKGKPVVTETGKKVVRELVPPGLLRLISGLKKLDGEVPLNQLRTVRNTIDNAIVEGRGLEDIGLRQLKQVRHALTETIEKGAESLDPDIGGNLKRANAFYRENIPAFEEPLIARMLKDKSTDPGFIRSYEMMDMIRSNPDTFRVVEKFLKDSIKEGGKAAGPSAAGTFNLLRRSIVEDIYRRSARSPGAGRYIDAKAFASELERFPDEIQAELLGVAEDTIRRNVDLLKRIKDGFEDVPMDQLEAFLRYPVNSVQDLSKLATARERQRKMFSNEIVNKLFKGDPNVDVNSIRLRSDEAVDWMLNAKNESDVSQFMALLGDNPDVVAKLRANTVADLFQSVAQKTRPQDAAKTDASHLVNPAGLIDALQDVDKRRRFRIIMGEENFRLLDNFAIAQAVLGKKGAQSLVGSQSRVSILKDISVLLRNLPDTVRYVLYSKIFTDRTLQRMIFEGAFAPETNVRDLTTLLINSPPVLNALAEEFDKTGAEMILQGVQDALTMFRNEDALNTQSGPRDGSATDPAVSRGDQLLEALGK